MPRIRRPSMNHAVMAVSSVLSSDASGLSPSNRSAANNGTTNTPSGTNPNPDLIISAKKILKLLRALDPRADNAHRGKERVIRLTKFRSYVDGRYAPDGNTRPPFREDDVRILFLGTQLDGSYVPGLLRACGTPSSNHSRVGHVELLKKSALPAMDLLCHLVCDLSVTEVNANSAVFGRVFCSLPSAELRQLRLSLHLAGFGGKREGSREDASRIFTNYLRTNAVTSNGDNAAAFSASNVLDELLGPSGSEARLGYGGWLLTQPPELRTAASEAGIVDVLPTRRQVGSVTMRKTNSGDPLSFAKGVMDDMDGPKNIVDGNAVQENDRPSQVASAPRSSQSRRLSDQAFRTSARPAAAAARTSNNQLSSAASPAVRASDGSGMAVSIDEFALLKSELAVSRASVEALQTTVDRLNKAVTDLLDRTQKNDVEHADTMDKLQKDNAQLLLDLNEIKSKMGLLKVSKGASIHGGTSTGSASNGRANSNDRRNRLSFVAAMNDSGSSQEAAGIAGNIRNVFQSMKKEQVSEEAAAMSADALLWDD